MDYKETLRKVAILTSRVSENISPVRSPNFQRVVKMGRPRHKGAPPRVRLLVFVDVAKVIASVMTLIVFVMWLLR